jgi:hypothetical protein
MTPDDELIGYLFDALEADDRLAVEAQVRTDPATAARLEQLRLAVAPILAARQPEPTPPPGLAARTIARLAEYLVAHRPSLDSPATTGSADRLVRPAVATPLPDHAPPQLATPARSPLPPAPREEPEVRLLGGRFRADLLVACGIALFAGGLLVSAIGKLRVRNELLACQNTLRTLHTGLTGYADTHAGRYPQVGVPPHTTAETFVNALVNAGQVPPGFRPGCPSERVNSPTPVGYTYTLGYRTPNGGLLGLRRHDGPGDLPDLMPISADYPAAVLAPAGGPVSPHGPYMNVLCIGGNVRLTSSALIGPNGDDIYRNLYGLVAAGADRTDVVLGRPGDMP